MLTSISCVCLIREKRRNSVWISFQFLFAFDYFIKSFQGCALADYRSPRSPRRTMGPKTTNFFKKKNDKLLAMAMPAKIRRNMKQLKYTFDESEKKVMRKSAVVRLGPSISIFVANVIAAKTLNKHHSYLTAADIVVSARMFECFMCKTYRYICATVWVHERKIYKNSQPKFKHALHTNSGRAERQQRAY